MSPPFRPRVSDALLAALFGTVVPAAALACPGHGEASTPWWLGGDHEPHEKDDAGSSDEDAADDDAGEESEDTDDADVRPVPDPPVETPPRRNPEWDRPRPAYGLPPPSPPPRR
jgi:hypothetical protein